MHSPPHHRLKISPRKGSRVTLRFLAGSLGVIRHSCARSALLDWSVRNVSAEIKGASLVSIGEPDPMEFYLEYQGKVPSSGGDESESQA